MPLEKSDVRKKREKKTKFQKAALDIMTLLFMMVCGGIVGYLMGRMNKELFHDGGVAAILFGTAAMLCVIVVVWMIHMYLHEVGHLLGGLATGYHFQSIRFGSLMLSENAEGRLKFTKYTLAGTGGQCLMLPPDEDAEGNYPTGIYNWGGCLMNLFLSVLCLVGWLCVGKNSMFAVLLLLGVLLGVGTALMNGIPLSALSNDGYNALVLRKSKDARKAFRLQLLMNDGMMKGKNLADFPEEWFAFGDACRMDNALTTSAVVLCFNRLMERRQFEEAERLGRRILNEAEVLADVHELMIQAELLFIETMRCENVDKAKEMYQKEGKRLAALKSMPSMQRVLYAYYLCIEQDDKKAEQARAAFEKLAKHYPLDLAEERSLMELAREKRQKL